MVLLSVTLFPPRNRDLRRVKPEQQTLTRPECRLQSAN
jgi:hypothetical protein